MAFRPWSLNCAHIESLCTNEQHSQKWSIPEILQASAILAYYHSLCGLVFGQGIKEDVDIAMSFEKSLKSGGGLTDGESTPHTMHH